MKILITGHGKFAQGMASAVEIIVGKQENVTFINSYVDDLDFKKDLKEYFELNDNVCVLTDVFGGSVNQAVISFMKEKNIEIVTGINLALTLELILENKNGNLTKEKISEILNNSKEQMIYVNEKFNNLDEDDFGEDM